MIIDEALFCVFDLRSHLGSSSDLRFSMVEGQDGHYSTTVIRRAQKGRLSALRDDPNKVLRLSRQETTSQTPTGALIQIKKRRSNLVPITYGSLHVLG